MIISSPFLFALLTHLELNPFIEIGNQALP